MAYDRVKNKRFSVELPHHFYRRLRAFAKRIDRSVANTAKGLILSSLVTDKEYDGWATTPPKDKNNAQKRI
jgi:hypothetical protein